MTDDPTTDAELISAYLDGEATPDEVARVRAEPALLSAVAELETLRGQLAVDGPPAGLVDDHVGAALAAFDGDLVEDDAPTAAVADLSTRRRPLLQRLPLGAIAAAVVLLALFGALTQIDTGDDDTATDETAAMSDSGDDDAGADGDADLYAGEGTESDAAADDAEASTAPSARSVLAFSSTDDLAGYLSVRSEELSAADETQGAEPDTSTTAAAVEDTEDAERPVDPCNAVEVAGVAPPTVTLVFPAVVAGAPVTAVVTETDDGRRLVVVDDGSCTVVDDRPL